MRMMTIKIDINNTEVGSLKVIHTEHLGNDWCQYKCVYVDIEGYESTFFVEHNTEEGSIVLAHKAIAIARKMAKKSDSKILEN